MATARTKTFMSGNSEALRLPKDMAYGVGVELNLARSGDVLTVYPKERKQDLKALAAALLALPRPGRPEVRDEEPLPEPPGL